MSEQTIDLIKDRSIRLFTYLSELTRLREPVIRSIDKNEQVLWFSDLPEEQECFSQAHGYEKEKDDIWLEIKKPMLPELPLLPIELTEWIKRSDLYNVLEEPQLMNHIPIPLLEDEESEEIKYLYLDDHPEINTGWKEYLENKWKSWRDEYLRSKKVQEVYSDLFGIYQLQKKLGEQFELIVGIGLLNWYTPSGQSVSRHLITKRVEIELNSDTGVITVRPSSEDEVTLEQDMLEVSERPDIDAQKDINNLLPSIAEDFWKKDNFELVLRSWVQTVSAEGRYLDKISRVKEFNNNPIVSFSPALILRKRTEKSFLRTYLTIINELKEGNNSIPLGVKRTVDILDDNNYNSKEIDLTKEEKVRDAEEYYLPLPTNDEQLKIVEQLKYRNGVIVQGPPGTGKSHTIANLICHLLSSGKKILITSQTPRALKVLKEKIPKELQSLCVSLLGNDSNSLKELENVVQGITDRHYKWDQVLNKKEINKLKADLHDLRSKQAQVRSKIRSIREVETYQHNLLKGEYRGTAQAIGTKIRSECAQLGWLDIKVPLDKPISHTNDEAVELIHLRRELNKEIIDEVQKSFLEPDFILKPDEMNDLFQREANAKEKWNQYKGLQTSEEFNALLKVQSDELLMTKTMIENLQNHFTGLAKYKGEWVKKAINDVLTNELSVWVELSRTLNEGLNGLMEVARFADAREIYIPEQYLATIVLADAKVLYNHLKNGGKLGFPGLRPKAVKIGWYILKEIRVDGKLCDNAEIIDELIKCITANERISKHLIIVQTQMAGNIHNHPARAIIVSELERISRELNTILNTKILVDQLASEVPSISDSNINTDNIHDNLNYYNELIDSIFAYKLLLTEEDSINQINEPLLKIINDKEAHDINQKLIEVIKNRDIKKYHSIFEELKELSTNLLKYKRFKELHNRLDPQIANILNSTGIDTDFKLWEQRLNVLKIAGDGLKRIIGFISSQIRTKKN